MGLEDEARERLRARATTPEQVAGDDRQARADAYRATVTGLTAEFVDLAVRYRAGTITLYEMRWSARPPFKYRRFCDAWQISDFVPAATHEEQGTDGVAIGVDGMVYTFQRLDFDCAVVGHSSSGQVWRPPLDIVRRIDLVGAAADIISGG